MSARSSSSTPQIRLRSCGPALRQQVEIVDQPRHRRIVAVGGLGLERQAFGERARADPGRLEVLDDRQRLLDPLDGLAGWRRRCRRAARSDSRSRRAFRRSSARDRRPAPARREAGRADARRASRRNIRRGRNRTPSSPPPESTTSEKLSVSSASLVQSTSSGRSSSAWPDDQIVGAGIVGRFVAVVARRSRNPRRPARLALLVGARFEQRVLRQFLGDERVELEVRQLQQLDRLRQLGRQHQLLRLADA